MKVNEWELAVFVMASTLVAHKLVDVRREIEELRAGKRNFKKLGLLIGELKKEVNGLEHDYKVTFKE